MLCQKIHYLVLIRIFSSGLGGYCPNSHIILTLPNDWDNVQQETFGSKLLCSFIFSLASSLTHPPSSFDHSVHSSIPCLKLNEWRSASPLPSMKIVFPLVNPWGKIGANSVPMGQLDTVTHKNGIIRIELSCNILQVLCQCYTL